jgi:hypothetical protein
LEDSVSSHHLKVQAFLIFDRVAGCEAFEVSVLLEADGQFLVKTSLGTVAEGQETLLSLRWDQPNQRFVASSQAPGAVPIESFIPFAAPGAKVSWQLTGVRHDAYDNSHRIRVEQDKPAAERGSYTHPEAARSQETKGDTNAPGRQR